MNRKSLLGISLALISGAALAQMGGTPPSDTTSPTTGGDVTTGAGIGASGNADFMKLDANADGKLSKDEAKKDAKVAKNWKTLDVDKDGSLSELEFSAGAGAGTEEKR